MAEPAQSAGWRQFRLYNGELLWIPPDTPDDKAVQMVQQREGELRQQPGFMRLGREAIGGLQNIETGVRKGVANLLSAPVEINRTLAAGGEQLQAYINERLGRLGIPPTAAIPITGPLALATFGSKNFARGAEAIGLPTNERAREILQGDRPDLITPPFPFHEPESGGGRLLQTTAEFATGAGGKAATIMSGLTGAGVQGLREYNLGHYEPFAAFLIPMGLNLSRITFGAIAPKRAVRMATDAIRRDNVGPGEMRAATDLINRAREMQQRIGIPPDQMAAPTFGQALAQVTAGRATSLLEIEAIIEASTGGREVLGQHFANVEAALPGMVREGGRAITSPRPPTGGARRIEAETLGRAAETQAIRQRGALTAQGSARIRAQENLQVPAATVADAWYELTVAMEGQTAATRRVIQQAITDLFQPGPNNSLILKSSLGDLDQWIKEYRDRVRPPGAGQIELTETASQRRTIERLVLPAVMRLRDQMARDFPNYGLGLREFERGMASAPEATAGPLGRLGEAERRLGAQADAVWTADTTPDEITRTFNALSARIPGTAARFIRNGIIDIFDEASMTDRWRAGNFLSSFTRRQADQLKAAVKALPHGDRRWKGFRDFLNIMEGYAFRIQQGIPFGGDFGGTQRAFGRARIPIPARAFTKTQVWIDDKLRRGNVHEFAQLVTDPRFERRIMAITSAPPRRKHDLALTLLNSFIDETANDFGQPQGATP